jgi:glycosyltransferase involved in cell wall biosynthesis
MLPYFLRHYQRFCERIVIYDNHSTDDSVAIIRSFSNTEVRHYESDNSMRSDRMTEIRDHAWKEARGHADYVIVCDIDEFLYHSNLIGFLEEKKREKITLFLPRGHQMIADHLPTAAGQIYDEITTGCRNRWFDKPCLFDPQAIEEINYGPGCHLCHPIGDVRLYRSTFDLKLLHFRWLGLDYVLKLHAERRDRVSEANRKNGLSVHYFISDEEVQRQFESQKQMAVHVVP